MKASYALRSVLLAAISWTAFAALTTSITLAQGVDDAEWIWSPAHQKQQVPQGACYFRRAFQVASPIEGQIQITADDAYELYVNGRQVGVGANWRTLDVFDITAYLLPGKNVIAVKAANGSGSTGALVARVVVKERGGTFVSHSTDTSWKSTLQEFPHWTTVAFDDAGWIAAQSFGQLGAVLPWGVEVQVAGAYGRFKTPPEFSVEWVIPPDETGSLIAMTFNERGRILAARENGPLLLIDDTDADGVHDRTTVYCDQVKNCQGLLSINNVVLTISDGPEGAALYRLTDTDRDDVIDQVDALIKFPGPMREHGAHAIRLGPDGLVYIMVGNHTSVADLAADSSPHRNYYEGDLVQSRYEDPGGHASGLKAPGGTVIRTDIDGSFVELFAGGLRNAYDFAFDRRGELFTYDSDMEWDEGTSWHRPTRILHVTPGGDFGWRSGWAKWPTYYLDSLPPTLDMGPGSPTGVERYDHFMYPVRYHNVLFVGDWAQGRIDVVRLSPAGASYTATSSAFVEGKPLNITDLEVGPDGWLYFCTGGRDTAGGIYRVVWNGTVPPEVTNLGEGIARALRFPQLSGSWSRRQVAIIKNQLGPSWDEEIRAVALDVATDEKLRLRALEVMQLFGPFPTADELVEISKDKSPALRAKAAYLMGIHTSQETSTRLVVMLEDADAAVRRTAIEALVRAGYQPPVPLLVGMLASSDRFVATAARVALQRVPQDKWEDLVLSNPRHRVFLYGATGLLAAYPDRQLAQRVLVRTRDILSGQTQEPGSPPGFVSDQDFLDLLRVTQLALLRGGLKREDVPVLSVQISQEFPSQNPIMNRELIRIMAHFGESEGLGRMMQYLAGGAPEVDKLHVAMFAPHIISGWTTDQKMQLLRYYESARALPGGNSLSGYVDRAARDFFDDLTPAQRRLVLRDGAKYPSSTLALLAGLPRDPGDETLSQIMQIDRELLIVEGEAADKLRIGVIAVLARSLDPKAMAYLREVYERDPKRRSMVAMGLAQDPQGENWPILIRSLPILQSPAGAEVLRQLATADRKPDDPEVIRQLILCGLKLGDQGGAEAARLLAHWTGATASQTDDAWDVALPQWQEWYAQTHSDRPPAVLPTDADSSKWTFAELLSYLESPDGSQGDLRRGLAVFEEAQCIKCHRFGGVGEAMGPDLTTVGQRFAKQEILQSILFPSHVISDQYASKTVVTVDGRTLTGMVAPAGEKSIIVLRSDGEKVEVPQGDIEEIAASEKSSMPEGLLNRLTLSDVADLFAFLQQRPTASVTSRRNSESPTIEAQRR